MPLQVSNLDAAARFAGAFGAKEAQEERVGAYKPPAVEQRVEAAHKVLGVREGASMGEISDAYRKLARVYHPDKVAWAASRGVGDLGAADEGDQHRLRRAQEQGAEPRAGQVSF